MGNQVNTDILNELLQITKLLEIQGYDQSVFKSKLFSRIIHDMDWTKRSKFDILIIVISHFDPFQLLEDICPDLVTRCFNVMA